MEIRVSSKVENKSVEVPTQHTNTSFLNGPTPASFSFIFGLFKQTIQFLQQINVKKCPNVHPVFGAGIRTNNLSNMNCHPLPLDQGFFTLKPITVLLVTRLFLPKLMLYLMKRSWTQKCFSFSSNIWAQPKDIQSAYSRPNKKCPWSA